MKNTYTLLRPARILMILAASLTLAAAPAQAYCGSCGAGDSKGAKHQHGKMKGAKEAKDHAMMKKADKPEHGSKATVTGEVVDMMCYIDHGAKGADHADCAERCIEGGGPVGILTKKDQLYLLVGDHAPANQELAQHAADTITVEGKFVKRNGVAMVENIRIVQ